jgi:hypothetical protein
MASVYAARYRKQPDMLRAAVMGQSPDPKLDSYTALNALRLVKEADMMAMAGQAQQPTSAPSLVAQAFAPPPMMQGLGAMVPGAMSGQGMPPQGMPPQQRAPMPQPTMQAASGGLAGMYTPEEDYAAGGIVAFQDRGYVNPNLTEGMEATAVTDDPLARLMAETQGGQPSMSALGRAQEALDKYMDFEPKEMSAKEQEAFLDRYMARVKKAGGPDIYAPAKEELKTRREALAGDRRTGEGMALLTAAGKVLKGRSLAEGASEALPAYAQQIGEVRRAEQQEKRAIEQMNFALADAERKERMGDARGAQAALAEARKFQQDANRAQGDKLRYGADIAARTVGYSKVNKGAGSGTDKEQPLDRVTAAMSDRLIEMRAKNPDDPQIKILEAKIKDRKEILGMGKEGPTAATRATNQLTGAQNRQLSKEMSAWQDSTEAKKALKMGNFDEVYDAEFARRQNALMSGISTTPASGNVIDYDANGKRITK